MGGRVVFKEERTADGVGGDEGQHAAALRRRLDALAGERKARRFALEGHKGNRETLLQAKIPAWSLIRWPPGSLPASSDQVNGTEADRTRWMAGSR